MINPLRKMKELFNLVLGPNGLILIGGILTLIGAFWSSRQEGYREKELNNKNEIIINKTQEIADLNAHIVSTLTGGDSYPIIELYTQPNNLSDGIPLMSLKGNIPITNVTGDFLDLREGPIAFRYKFNRDILSPAHSTLIGETSFDLSKGRRFQAMFFTPYHVFRQIIAIEMTKQGKPINAWILYKDDKLIAVEYSKDFPIPFEEIDILKSLTDEQIKTARELTKKKSN